MKKAYLRELQGKLLGSVTDNPDALNHFSTDGSIFQITPAAVVYPANTADVRKIVQFAHERTTAGKPVSLVPRGKGSDQGGAALGEGMQVVFPAHMDKLLKLDRDTVTVQPGILYKTLQQTLHTHGRFLPPYPACIDYSTIGGAVANNASGEKSVKYGATREFVRGLKVVLSDGSIIQTQRISARELNRKKGLTTLEGEIYRKFDSLLLDNSALIRKHQVRTSRNSAGYALDAVKGRDGSFDLSQVFVGSQGTLGLITEVTLKTLPFNPRNTLVVGYLDSVGNLGDIVTKLRALGPSALEMVDRNLLEFLRTHRPGDLTNLVPEKLPAAILLVEFNEFSQLNQKVKATRAQRLFGRMAKGSRVSTDPVEQMALWKVRHSASAAIWMGHGPKKALPFIDDSVVPVSKLSLFMDKTYKLLAKHSLEAAIWGHAGDGNLHLQPNLDLSKHKDVDKLFNLSREFYEMVIALGGTTSGGGGDGLLRALQLKHLYGEELLELFAAVKHIFDPQDIFNPMQKTAATEEFAKNHLRNEYSLKNFDHVIYS